MGSLLADTDAAGLRYHDILDVIALDLVSQFIKHRSCAGCDTAGRHTDEDTGLAFLLHEDQAVPAFSRIAFSSSRLFIIIFLSNGVHFLFNCSMIGFLLILDQI